MSTDTFERIVSFVRREIGRTNVELTRETGLDRHLRVTGDDAVTFMDAFFKEFNVDPTGFDFRVYFDAEGFDPVGLSYLIRRVRGIEQPKERKDLTLRALEIAATIGRWPEAR